MYIERLASNLTILRNEDTTDLAVLETRHNELQRELEGLNSSMKILQPMVTQLRESGQGAIDPWGVLYESLQQSQYDEASMTPHLENPLLSDAVNREGSQNKTLLHLAIAQGHIALIRNLISQGAAVNVRDQSGHTPLQYAADNQEAISLLLGAGAVQDLTPNWQLQGQYESNDQQMILTIGDNTPGRLQQARDPQAQWRITNMTWSEGVGGMDIRNTVLQHGENRVPLAINMYTLTEAPTLQVLLQGPDRALQSIRIDLREVCVARLQEKERALTERSVDMDQYIQNTEAVYQLPPETVTDPRVNREKKNEVGTLSGRLEAFQTQYERDMQAFSSNLNTLGQIQFNERLPVFRRNQQRIEDAISSLKSVQIQLQQQCTTAHEALFKTLKNEDQQASMVLLEDSQLDVNKRNERGDTFLQLAVTKKNIDAVKILLDHGADINEQDANGKTALMKASKYGHEECVSLLLGNSANMNIRDESGRTALYQAAISGHAQVVGILLERGVDVEPLLQELQSKERDKNKLMYSLRQAEKTIANYAPIQVVAEHIYTANNRAIPLSKMARLRLINETLLPELMESINSIQLELRYFEKINRGLNEADRFGRLPLHDAIRNTSSTIGFLKFLAERTDKLFKDLNAGLDSASVAYYVEGQDYDYDDEGYCVVIPRTFLDVAKDFGNANAIKVLQELGVPMGEEFY